ncbi:MAG: HD domain-containing protein [Treponema sp.]|jgi:GTP pyrophosphokinase|nr:HD domain-containing protein [Treponema sp.]
MDDINRDAINLDNIKLDNIILFEEKIALCEKRDRDRILRALKAAADRKTGRVPEKALGVASILADLNLDADTLIASLLLETGAPEPEAIGGEFGPGAAGLVEGAARIGGISVKNKSRHEAEIIRKMLLAMAADIRVIFIRLAEKLYFMRNLDSAGDGGQKPAVQECLDIYAPLADRLGISWIKDELEDLSLKFLNREAYRQIKDIVAEKRGERNEFLNGVEEDIRGEAAAAGIVIEVASRAKHFYSIYQKMRKRNKSAEDIFDLFGIRILCGSIENCYTLLGLVHRLWKPIDGRFKDYIAMPKSNGYQSLHTTVIIDEDSAPSAHAASPRLLEIQIRTHEMHHIAEYGIASHWLYKHGSARDAVRPVDISIVNRLRDWKQGEHAGPGPDDSFLEDIRREILKDSIYVFTPQGKVIELPAGATPIDFAYSIHTAVGEHCLGARADGAIIPLGSELKNTQVVEILTSQAAHPHLNWLRLVKTSKARGKIRSWLEQHDSIIIEKNVVAKKKPAAEDVKPAPAPARQEETGAVQQVPESNNEASIFHVRVEDEKNMMIHFARCCRPVAGEPIIGYVSRGRGIIVHRKSCRNLANIPDFEERKIETEWENSFSALVKRFRIEARSQANFFSEIEGAVRKYQGHLIEGRLEETAPNRLTGFFTMQLENAGDLKKLVRNIRLIPGVLGIQTLT